MTHDRTRQSTRERKRGRGKEKERDIDRMGFSNLLEVFRGSARVGVHDEADLT